MVVAVETSDKLRHGLVRRPRLHRVICAPLALALAARKRVRGGLDFAVEFALYASSVFRDHCSPLAGVHFLVRHVRSLPRFYVPAHYSRTQFGVFAQIRPKTLEPVLVQLHKIGVVPFFHHLVRSRLLYGIIINTLLEVIAYFIVCNVFAYNACAHFCPELDWICNGPHLLE